MSGRQLAVIMDPIESIKPHKDSSLAMLVEAQTRGWKIHYAELQDIGLRDGEAIGRLRALKVADDETKWFDLGDDAMRPSFFRRVGRHFVVGFSVSAPRRHANR